ncbi:unnamed protein product [Brassica oleracea]
MINFVQKDFGEIFPRWDFDVEDSAAENIIKKEVSAAETESGVKEESGRPRKKARKEARKEASVWAHEEASKVPPIEARLEASTTFGGRTKEKIEKIFRDIAEAMRNGFGMCLKEIKFLGDRIESVNEAKAGQNDDQEPSSSKELSLVIANEPKPPKHSGEPSVHVLDKGVPTVSD